MGYEGQDFSDIAGGVSPAFIDALYTRFKASPDSVEPGWRGFFEGLENGASGPSWLTICSSVGPPEKASSASAALAYVESTASAPRAAWRLGAAASADARAAMAGARVHPRPQPRSRRGSTRSSAPCLGLARARLGRA